MVLKEFPQDSKYNFNKYSWFKLPVNIFFFLSKFKNNNLTSLLSNLGLVLTVHVKILSH